MAGLLGRSGPLPFWSQNEAVASADCEPVLAGLDGRAAHFFNRELATESAINWSRFQVQDAGD